MSFRNVASIHGSLKKYWALI